MVQPVIFATAMRLHVRLTYSAALWETHIGDGRISHLAAEQLRGTCAAAAIVPGFQNEVSIMSGLVSEAKTDIEDDATVEEGGA
jgi:hypothetical protein